MSLEDPSRDQQLFLAALEIPSQDRDAWLVRECGDDHELLAVVCRLLANDDSSIRTLDQGLGRSALQEIGLVPRRDRALHLKCPHCHCPVEIVSTDSERELTCDSCGSHFSLVEVDKTESWKASSEQSIGRFKLLQRVGVGAFGSVYKAVDERLDRIVAVKIPRNGNLSSQDRSLFLREARTAAQLRHPNIVSVHEVGEEEGRIYIVSDFIDGLTLADRMTGGRMGQHEAVRLMITIVDAIQFAHDHGVTHRDLKPSNLMLDHQQCPYVMDFGLAKRDAGEVTMTVDGQILGTPAYMSPELASGDGRNADPRTDIYSLGVILFELLSGERPFRGNTRMLLHQVMYDDAPTPRRFNSAIARDLETICLKCLEKSPDNRYQSASELSEDLGRFLQGRPVHARAISRIERFARVCRRNSTIASLAALAVVLLFAGSAASLYFGISAGKSATAAEVAAAQSRRAEEQAKVAEGLARRDRQAAEDSLHESLLSQSELLRLSRNPGYREALRKNLKQAIAIRPNSAGSQRLRQIASSALGDPFARQAAMTSGFPAEIIHVAATDKSSLVACGCADGSVWFCDASKGNILFPLESNEPRRLVGFSDGAGLLVTVNGSSKVLQGDAVSIDKVEKAWSSELPGNPVCASLSVDGVFAAVGCVGDESSHLRVYRASDGNGIAKREFPGTVRKLAISADGTKLAINRGSSRIHVLDLESGKLLGVIDPELAVVEQLKFNHNSDLLAVGCREGVAAYSVDDLKIRGKVLGHNVRSLEFLNDGQTLVYSSIQSNSIQIWNVITNRHNREINFDEEPVEITIGAAGSHFVLATKRVLHSWSRRTPEKLQFTGHAGGVPGMAFSPDGNKLATVGKDGICRIHSVESGKPENSFRVHGSAAQSVAWLQDGQFVVTAGFNSGTVRVWSVEDGEEKLEIPHSCGPNNALVSGPGGLNVAIAGLKGVEVWSVGANSHDQLTTERRDKPTNGSAGSLAFNASGTAVCWSEFVSGTSNGNAFVSRLGSNAEVLSIPSAVHRPFQNLAFCQDDELLLLTPSFVAEKWNTRTAKVALSFDVSLRDPTTAIYDSHVAISPDGTRLAASSVRGNAVNIWNLSTGQLEFPLPADDGIVWFLAWAPNGNSLAVSRNSGEIAVWNLSSVTQQLSELGLRW